MSKLLRIEQEIKECEDCYYWTWENCCTHPKFQNAVRWQLALSLPKIDDWRKIPKWCPLPNYEDMYDTQER